MRESEKGGNRLDNWFGKWWKKGFQRDNFIVMVLVGILLVIIALPIRKTDQSEVTIQEEGIKDLYGSGGGDRIMTGGTGGIEIEEKEVEKGGLEENDYEKLQEEKLEKLLTAMDGVGKVQVMLTFVSSEEQVVEKEEPMTRSNTVERDSEGGNRTITQYEKGDTTVYREQGGEPFVIKTLYPRVEGVLVVAEGAGDGTVNRNITEAVQALFGVEAHRVKVLSMGR